MVQIATRANDGLVTILQPVMSLIEHSLLANLYRVSWHWDWVYLFPSVAIEMVWATALLYNAVAAVHHQGRKGCPKTAPRSGHRIGLRYNRSGQEKRSPLPHSLSPKGGGVEEQGVFSI